MNNDFDDDDDLVDAYLRILQISVKLQRSPEPLHQDFAQHLMKVANALNAINKVEGGDSPKGGDVKPILAVLKPEDRYNSAERSFEKARTTQDQI
jgi:hypothetical protein